MEKITALITGKKKYVAAAFVGAVAAAQALGYDVPGWVHAVAAAIGIV